MSQEFKSISENAVLNENTKKQLQEEMEQRIEEAKKAIEEDVRAEYAKKFNMKVEEYEQAIDEYITQVIEREIGELHETTKQATQARVELTQAKHALKEDYKNKVEKLVEAADKAITRAVEKEVKESYKDRKELVQQKKRVAEELRENRKLYKQQMAKQVDVMSNFVTERITAELTEFHRDRRALVEKRAQLISEGRKELEEAKKRFFERGAALIEKVMESQLQTELRELKEDIRNAQENRFGRKLFDAFISEFYSSHLADGTKSKKLMIENQQKDKELRQALGLLSKQQSLLEGTVRKTQRLEEANKRQKIVDSLVAPLPKNQQRVMREMLENSKTEKLKENFNQILPIILDKVPANSAASSKKTLSESKKPVQKIQSRKEITGNRRSAGARLSESVNTNDTNALTGEINRMKVLAGTARK